MKTNTLQRRATGWLLFTSCTLGLIMALTFRTQAQSSGTHEKEPKTKAAAPGQSNAKGRVMEMDRLTEEELARAQEELARAQQKIASQDWAKVEAELAKAAVEVEKAMKASHVAMEKAALEKTFADVQRELSRNKVNLEKEMKKAEAAMERAQKDLKLMEEGMQEMQKDGLIKKGESIELKWDGDTLILNGQRQPAGVSEKYKKYFNKQHFEKKQKDYKKVVI